MTLDEIKSRLIEAAATLRRLPLAARDMPAGLGTYWPAVLHDPFEAALEPDAGIEIEGIRQYYSIQVRPAAPSPGEIHRMQECLDWMLWLTGPQRIAVWGVAQGVRRNRLGRMLHCGPVTVWRRQTEGLLRISAGMGQKKT